MKKQIYSLSILLVIFFVLNLNVNAQKKGKPFKGYVKYKISYEGEMDAQQKQMAPSEQIVYLMGTKSKVEVKTPMFTQSFVSDSKTKEGFVLMNIEAMGKKVAIMSNKEDIEKSLAEMPKVDLKVSQETKEIAGYTCVKTELFSEVEGEEVITLLYSTEYINVENPNWMTQFRDIKGVLLEYSQVIGEVTTTYKAVEVKKGKVKDATFKVPADYKILTKEEVAALFGGGNSDVDDL